MKAMSVCTIGALVVLLAGSIVAADRSEPAPFNVWTSAQLRELESSARTGRALPIHLVEYDNYGFDFMLRNKGGGASVHETQSDVLIIQSGEGVLVMGGTLTEPKRVGPHELRGLSIAGGEKVKLRAGDIVHVAPGTPHKVELEEGKELVFFAIKIDKPGSK